MSSVSGARAIQIGPPGMDPLLKIVIADESPVRSAIIGEGLREAGYTQVTRIEEMTSLLARIYATDPDVSRDVLEQCSRSAAS